MPLSSNDYLNSFEVQSFDRRLHRVLIGEELAHFCNGCVSRQEVLMFPAMLSPERYLIHQATTESCVPNLKSLSIGEEPNRRTVVYFSRTQFTSDQRYQGMTTSREVSSEGGNYVYPGSISKPRERIRKPERELYVPRHRRLTPGMTKPKSQTTLDNLDTVEPSRKGTQVEMNKHSYLDKASDNFKKPSNIEVIDDSKQNQRKDLSNGSTKSHTTGVKIKKVRKRDNEKTRRRGSDVNVTNEVSHAEVEASTMRLNRHEVQKKERNRIKRHSHGQTKRHMHNNVFSSFSFTFAEKVLCSVWKDLKSNMLEVKTTSGMLTQSLLGAFATDITKSILQNVFCDLSLFNYGKLPAEEPSHTCNLADTTSTPIECKKENSLSMIGKDTSGRGNEIQDFANTLTLSIVKHSIGRVLSEQKEDKVTDTNIVQKSFPAPITSEQSTNTSEGYKGVESIDSQAPTHTKDSALPQLEDSSAPPLGKSKLKQSKEKKKTKKQKSKSSIIEEGETKISGTKLKRTKKPTRKSSDLDKTDMKHESDKSRNIPLDEKGHWEETSLYPLPLKTANHPVGGSEIDDWDTQWDDDGKCLDARTMKELAELTGISKPVIKHSKIDYHNFTPQDVEVSETDYGHIIEVNGFSKEFKTSDICMSLASMGVKDFNLQWVDDTHALAVFSSAVTAQSCLGILSPAFKLTPISQASRQSKLKARLYRDVLLPYKERPETSAFVARNMVASALGLRSKVGAQQRADERRQLKEARERKKQREKAKADIWGD